MNTSLSDWSSHHTVAEDSAVLECYSASGKWFVTLQRIVVPSPWSQAVCSTLTKNALHSFKASVTASLKTGIFMNNSNFTQRSWFVLLAAAASLCLWKGAQLVGPKWTVCDRCYRQKKPYCWCFEEEDGEANCTAWNKYAVDVLWSAERLWQYKGPCIAAQYVYC
jgi:hypothetical protein